MKAPFAAAASLIAISLNVHAGDFTDSARVMSATPIIERVTDVSNDCGREPVAVNYPEKERSMTGAVLGGVAGAILGHQVGQGRGNTAATAAGAIGGAMVGDRVDNSRSARSTPLREARCRQVESVREVVRGYDVVYRYNGRDVSTSLPYNPGDRVTVSVAVIPEGPRDR